MTHYETLGIAPDASDAEIKAAYRKKASRTHPDRKDGDGKAMARINVAYQTLSDKEKRERYDRTGEDGPQSSIEDEARDLLLHAMNEVLQQSSEHENVIAKLQQVLDGALKASKAEAKSAGDLIKKINKRRKTIRAKGPNLFDLLFDQQTSQCKQRIDQAELGIKRVTAALELLKAGDYEFVAPEQPISSGYTGMWTVCGSPEELADLFRRART